MPKDTEPAKPPKLVPRFVVRLDDATFEALRTYAFERRQPQSAIVRMAVHEFLERRK
jgi:predicted transcriptional regulator